METDSMADNNLVQIKGRIMDDLKETSYYGLSEYSTTLERTETWSNGGSAVHHYPVAVSSENHKRMKDIMKADSEVMIFGYLRNKKKPASEQHYQPTFVVAEHAVAV